jgi:hypothetical protein
LYALTLATLTALVTPALGAPGDISVSGMIDQQGVREVDTTVLSDAYQTVVRQVGAAIANPTLPARTLGITGMELSVNTTASFISSRSADPSSPSPWARANPEEAPATFLVQPGLSVRKGLPMSLEVGANGNWIAQSRSGSFGGYARLAIVEGYRPFPDLAVQVGYAGYVGNPELEVGVLDLSVSLGTEVPVGPLKRIKSGQFSPWISYSMLAISAAPVVDNATRDALGVTVNRGATDTQDSARGFVDHRVMGGLQFVNGGFLLRFSGSWTVGSTPTAAASVGFVY